MRATVLITQPVPQQTLHHVHVVSNSLNNHNLAGHIDRAQWHPFKPGKISVVQELEGTSCTFAGFSITHYCASLFHHEDGKSFVKDVRVRKYSYIVSSCAHSWSQIYSFCLRSIWNWKWESSDEKETKTEREVGERDGADLLVVYFTEEGLMLILDHIHLQLLSIWSQWSCWNEWKSWKPWKKDTSVFLFFLKWQTGALLK